MIDTAELVLLFSPDPVYAAKAGSALASLGIRVRAVAPAEVIQTVGYLADLPGQSTAPKALVPPTLSEPAMVMAGLSSERMSLLFAALRAAGAPPCDRKAVLTPTNLGWSFKDLYDELGREHEEIHKKR